MPVEMYIKDADSAWNLGYRIWSRLEYYYVEQRLMVQGVTYSNEDEHEAYAREIGRWTHGDYTGLQLTIGDISSAFGNKEKEALDALKNRFLERIENICPDFFSYMGGSVTEKKAKQDTWEKIQCWDAALLFDVPGAFLHSSRKPGEPGFVAYTEDAKKAIQDRQTRIRFGRYLSKYFSDILPARVIGQIAAMYTGTGDGTIAVHFGKTREDFKNVYRYGRGPESCMAKPEGHFKTGDIFPVEAYASGDFGIAWAYEPGKEGDDAPIVARAVVCDINKTYVRIYTIDDSKYKEPFRHGLVEAGYALDEYWPTGARFLRLKTQEGYHIGPYVDGLSAPIYSKHGDDKYVYFAEGHDEIGHSTNSHESGGFFTNEDEIDLRDPDGYCEVCGSGIVFDEDSYEEVVDGDCLCENCVETAIGRTHARVICNRWGSSSVYTTNYPYITAGDGTNFTSEYIAERNGYVDIDGVYCLEEDTSYDDFEQQRILTSHGVVAYGDDGEKYFTHSRNVGKFGLSLEPRESLEKA